MTDATRTIFLEQCWPADPETESEGWYALRGAGNWASIEGTASEWLAIAASVLRRGNKSFKRCAVSTRVVAPFAGGTGGREFVFHSPRNANGPNDYIKLGVPEADALAKQIAECLTEAGEFRGVEAGQP